MDGEGVGREKPLTGRPEVDRQWAMTESLASTQESPICICHCNGLQLKLDRTTTSLSLHTHNTWKTSTNNWRSSRHDRACFCDGTTSQGGRASGSPLLRLERALTQVALSTSRAAA